MQRQKKRPFRIRDAAVMVAATGFGLAGWRYWFWATLTDWSYLWPAGDLWNLGRWLVAAQRVVPFSSIMLLSLTVGVLFLRVVTDRPRRRRLWCQPGFLACVAVVFAFACKSVEIGFNLAANVLTARPGQFANIDYGAAAGECVLMLLGNSPDGYQAKAGEVILLTWLVTWAGGRCRPEPSWVDRSGRLLGAAWVLVSALDVLRVFLR
ncbi:MAG: hypothetical protein P4L85_29445 [Paludisphaera borealis]|uniref:hypothetical protein n=1 Tax=Paludisphaera borealis TaxID=1387353 RepID=UPI00283CA455|nr:hypothetical protein [Paludisphaera borealis]MDR3623494.1 hypothetical protein [Paludisphaera borealis]